MPLRPCRHAVGLLVMLAPQFAFKPGRDAIQKHYQGIIDAGATSITLELKNLELRWQRWRMGRRDPFGHRQRQEDRGQLV